MRAHKLRRLVRNIHEHTRRTRALHLRINRARHDVARGQRTALVVFVHELPPVLVHEPTALAAHRFADEESARLGVKKTRRVKLDELHVCDLRPRAPRHRHTVPCRDVRIRRVEIHFSATTRRQHQPVAAHRQHIARRLVQNIHAHAAVGPGVTELAQRQQIHRHVIFQQSDSRLARNRIQQRPLDFASRRISCVQDAPCAVTALAREIRRAVRLLVKLHTNLHQLADALRPVAHDTAHHRLIAKPRARIQRIAHMRLKRIRLIRHRRNPALRPRRIRLRLRLLRNDGHAPRARRLQRKAQPRDPAADDDVVELKHPAVCPLPRRKTRIRREKTQCVRASPLITHILRM